MPSVAVVLPAFSGIIVFVVAIVAFVALFALAQFGPVVITLNGFFAIVDFALVLLSVTVILALVVAFVGAGICCPDGNRKNCSGHQNCNWFHRLSPKNYAVSFHQTDWSERA